MTRFQRYVGYHHYMELNNAADRYMCGDHIFSNSPKGQHLLFGEWLEYHRIIII